MLLLLLEHSSYLLLATCLKLLLTTFSCQNLTVLSFIYSHFMDFCFILEHKSLYCFVTLLLKDWDPLKQHQPTHTDKDYLLSRSGPTNMEHGEQL